MNIFCEDTLLYGNEFFSDWGTVTPFSGNKLTAEDIQDADLLFVRSTTKVTPALLAKAGKLKLVATATSGQEHVDSNYLRSKNIAFTAAPGCNAIAVAEYVIAAILHTLPHHNKPLFNLSVGIIGAGNVGSCLDKKLKALGIQTLLCDPPLAQGNDPRQFVGLDEVLQADIITLHVPLIESGPHQTRNLLDAKRLLQLSPQQVLINASRGEVLCPKTLSEISLATARPALVMDVWDNEPDIDFDLAGRVDIATPHIAGHTIEGKARGTEMVYQFAAQHLGLVATKTIWDFLPKARFPKSPLQQQFTESDICTLVRQVYDIAKDSKQFIAHVNDAAGFRYSRKNYAIRREFAAMQVNAGKSEHSEAIYRLGFSSEI
ncbi:MAG: 4-phosphoerythronate dehydrogenase [Aestuariibacter sp.]